ncbi:MAG: hypothetical protein V4651_02735 [Bacteroidota bacterium]
MFSCKKNACADAEVKVIMLSSTQLQKVHYKGNDTVTCMIDSDTITLLSNAKRQYFNTVSDGKTCEGINKKLEGYEILLKDSSSSHTLYHNQNRSFITDSAFVITVTYNTVSFEITEAKLNSAFYTKPDLMVNGKLYHHVYLGANVNNDSLYYSLDIGVIRFKTQGHILQVL